MAIITSLNDNGKLSLAHDSSKYAHPSGNVYAYTKGGKGNKRIKIELFKHFHNRLLAELVFCLEHRFSYRGDEFWGFIRPTTQLKTINKAKVDGDVGYQQSLMEEVGMHDKETFGRLFDRVGIRYASASVHEKTPHKFGEISEKTPHGTHFYSCYLNRQNHRTYFQRNNIVVNKIMNDIRKTLEMPHSKIIL